MKNQSRNLTQIQYTAQDGGFVEYLLNKKLLIKTKTAIIPNPASSTSVTATSLLNSFNTEYYAVRNSNKHYKIEHFLNRVKIRAILPSNQRNMVYKDLTIAACRHTDLDSFEIFYLNLDDYLKFLFFFFKGWEARTDTWDERTFWRGLSVTTFNSQIQVLFKKFFFEIFLRDEELYSWSVQTAVNQIGDFFKKKLACIVQNLFLENLSNWQFLSFALVGFMNEGKEIKHLRRDDQSLLRKLLVSTLDQGEHLEMGLEQEEGVKMRKIVQKLVRLIDLRPLVFQKDYEVCFCNQLKQKFGQLPKYIQKLVESVPVGSYSGKTEFGLDLRYALPDVQNEDDPERERRLQNKKTFFEVLKLRSLLHDEYEDTEFKSAGKHQHEWSKYCYCQLQAAEAQNRLNKLRIKEFVSLFWNGSGGAVNNQGDDNEGPLEEQRNLSNKNLLKILVTGLIKSLNNDKLYTGRAWKPEFAGALGYLLKTYNNHFGEISVRMLELGLMRLECLDWLTAVKRGQKGKKNSKKSAKMTNLGGLENSVKVVNLDDLDQPMLGIRLKRITKEVHNAKRVREILKRDPELRGKANEKISIFDSQVDKELIQVVNLGKNFKYQLFLIGNIKVQSTRSGRYSQQNWKIKADGRNLFISQCERYSNMSNVILVSPLEVFRIADNPIYPIRTKNYLVIVEVCSLYRTSFIRNNGVVGGFSVTFICPKSRKMLKRVKINFPKFRTKLKQRSLRVVYKAPRDLYLSTEDTLIDLFGKTTQSLDPTTLECAQGSKHPLRSLKTRFVPIISNKDSAFLTILSSTLKKVKFNKKVLENQKVKILCKNETEVDSVILTGSRTTLIHPIVLEDDLRVSIVQEQQWEGPTTSLYALLTSTADPSLDCLAKIEFRTKLGKMIKNAYRVRVLGDRLKILSKNGIFDYLFEDLRRAVVRVRRKDLVFRKARAAGLKAGDVVLGNGCGGGGMEVKKKGEGKKLGKRSKKKVLAVGRGGCGGLLGQMAGRLNFSNSV